MRHLCQALAIALVMLARTVSAQDDSTMIRLIRQTIDNNPRLPADRERNVDRHPICPPDLSRAATISGADAHVWMVIGRCALKQQDKKTAEDAFRKVVAIAPSAESYSLLAIVLVNESRLDDVPQLLREGAQLDPAEDQLFRAWGAYYRARGDLRSAADSYHRAIAILYPDGLGLFEYDDDSATLGDIYRELGDHQTAVRAYQDACFVYICTAEPTTLNYGRELRALGRDDELKLLIASISRGQEHAADQLRMEAKKPNQ
jgi:tetratricopeptide (TPR) repeat protein